MVSDTYYAVFVEEVENYKKQYSIFSGIIDSVTKLDSTTDALNGYLREREAHWWKWFDQGELQDKVMQDTYMR